MNSNRFDDTCSPENAPPWVVWELEFYDHEVCLGSLDLSRDDTIRIRDHYRLEHHLMAGEYEIDCSPGSFVHTHFDVPKNTRSGFIGSRDTRDRGV